MMRTQIVIVAFLAMQCHDGESEDLMPNADEPMPNILMIVADDLGVNDLRGFGGNEEVSTPHMDELFRQGVVFGRHYTTGDICAPTRASLVTGLYPQRLQFRIQHRGISEDVVTLADLFRSNGYATHHVGKWHLGGDLPAVQPLAQGYDTFFGFLNQLRLGGSKKKGGAPATYFDPFLSRNGLPEESVPGHLTDILSEHAVDVIEKSKEAGPWFMTVWYFAPHGPIQPPEKWLKHYAHQKNRKRARYYALISALDEGVGKLLSALDETGQKNNTVVVFLSDNGATRPLSNYPYYGKKNQFYEGGLRTPLVFSHPGEWLPALIGDVVSSLDVYSTLAASAGISVEHSVDGVNLLPLIQGESIEPRNLFWESKEIGSLDEGLAYDFSVLSEDGRWRYVDQGSEISLFDLQADPAGKKNVLEEAPDIASELHDEYLA